MYNSELIYPVHYDNFNELLEPGDLQNGDKIYTVHLWNHNSHDVEVQRDSPFYKLAKQHCPIICELFGDVFRTAPSTLHGAPRPSERRFP